MAILVPRWLDFSWQASCVLYPGFPIFNLEKKLMYLTGTRGAVDRDTRHTRGFRRFDADLGGECGHLPININK
jgi:hypothetical protein